MSKLQIGLAIAGVLLLAGLVLHGIWTARRHQPRLADPEPEGTTRHSDQTTAPVDPVLGAVPAADGLLLPPAAEKKPLLDPLIDVLASIELEHPVSGEAVLQHMPATRRVGSKPYSIEGLLQADGQWEPPQPGRRYSALQAGVQLANRAGALNEIEYSEFVVKTQALADALGGTPEFPDMLDATGHSRVAWLLDLSLEPLRVHAALEQKFGIRGPSGEMRTGPGAYSSAPMSGATRG